MPDTPGQYSICAKADADGVVTERDETNNTLCTGTTVTARRGGGGLIFAGDTNPAMITAGNAAKLTANIIGSANAATIITGPSSQNSDATKYRRSGLTDLARRLNRGFRDTLMHTTQASFAQRIVPAVVPIDTTERCDSGSVRTFGTLKKKGTGTLRIVYNDCRTGDETLSGKATLRVDVVDLSNLIPTDFTVSVSHLRLRGSGVDVAVGGSLRSHLSLGTSTETVTSNLVTLDNNTGEMTQAEHLVFVNVYDNILARSSYTETISGQVFDSVHGFVDVATIEPGVFSTHLQLFPNPGQLILTGAEHRSIRVTAISATQVMLELDLDGDANYELWTTILWPEVSATTVVDFERPTAPVVSVRVNIDGSVAISWSPSSDSNGIREYRVRGGTLPIGRTTGTSFTDTSVEPGSTVDYYVRAVDNGGNLSDVISRTSAKIPSSGTGTFAPPISGTLPFQNASGVGIGVADVNGDGSRDLVVSGGDVQIATALGPLTAGMSFTASPTDFATMTNDSNLPFFQLANIAGSELPEALGAGRTLVWNTTNNAWEDSAGSKQSFQFVARAYIDLNDDGILDIVNVTSASDLSSRLSGTLGTGKGSYDASSTRELAGIQNFVWSGIGAIVPTDVDRDGLTDLMCSLTTCRELVG